MNVADPYGLDGPPGPSGRVCPPGAGGNCDHELPECANGRDDDRDGLADFPRDTDCANPFGTTEVPEPGSTAMLVFGLAQLYFIAARRRRR